MKEFENESLDSVERAVDASEFEPDSAVTRITIHDAFAKIKILEKRIPQKLGRLKFTGSFVQSTNKVNGRSVSEEAEQIKNEYQSVMDDLAMLEQLKSKISQSNAVTKIKVGDTCYTIAEALAKKKTITFQQQMLIKMMDSIDRSRREVDYRNQDVQDKADDVIKQMTSGDKSIETEDIIKLRDDYVKQSSWTLFDPLKLQEKIDALAKEIDEFNSSVDSALSNSNATTMIVVI